MFFKVDQGVFLMQRPDYLVPLKRHNTQSDKDVLIHYLGGEVFKFPKEAVYDEQTALGIIKRYIESQESDQSFNWVDL